MQNRFERCLIEQCAPTLAGIKPGSLFNYTAETGEDIHELILGWNKTLAVKGLSVCLVKEGACGGLVYVYRSAMLAKLLSDKDVGTFLGNRRFPRGDAEVCIEEFRRRFRDEDRFPHEIGIFLGYPLQDVRGFIENKGNNFSLCGMWKVYEDKALAEKLFAQYKKCKDIYTKLYDNGRDIVKLTVTA